MAYDENRWENRRYGRSDDDRDRWRSEGRDWRAGSGAGRGADDRSDWGRGDWGHSEWRRGDVMRGDWGRDDRAREDTARYPREDYRGYGGRGYGGDYGGDYGRDTDRYRGEGSRGAGVYGGGRDERHGREDYGREDYGRGYGQGRGFAGYGRDEWGGAGRESGTRVRDLSRDDRSRGEDRGWLERTGDEIASWFGDEDAERRRRMDERRAGEHRGRGPRSYSRSDERIREDVSDRLTDDSYVDASDIEITVSKGEVTLSGHVDSRMAKRRAEDIAESVSGVGHVQNNLRVRQPTGMATGASTAAGASAMAGMGATGAGTGGTAGQGETSGADPTRTRTRV